MICRCHSKIPAFRSRGTSSGENAFYDPRDPNGMCHVFKHFIVRQLSGARALCASTTPSINSSRRLRPYTFAHPTVQ
ncbi:MAG: hypothetical protein IMX06_11130 [Kyrpidia tusciae]|nr:hypothetical protein [Kyrpidia tusciae]